MTAVRDAPGQDQQDGIGALAGLPGLETVSEQLAGSRRQRAGSPRRRTRPAAPRSRTPSDCHVSRRAAALGGSD